MSTQPDNRTGAETALWEAMQDRARNIRKAGIGFGERQHYSFAKAYHDGELIDTLNRVMEEYAVHGSENEHNLRGMAKTLKRGFPLWEHLLLETDKPWSPYISARAKKGAQASIDAGTDYIRYL